MTNTNPRCPHCGESIEIMSASEIVESARESGWDRFHVNYLGKLVKDGKFPEPWLASAGRQFWLQTDYETWWDARSSQSRRKAAEMAAQVAAGMSDAEFKRYLKEIEAARQAVKA